MRIDVHTHIGYASNGFTSDKYPYCQDAYDLYNKLSENGFDYAVTFPFPNYSYTEADPDIIPYYVENKKIMEESWLFGNKFLPFAGFSINYAIDLQIEKLSQMVNSGQLYGLKYYADSDERTIAEFLNRGKKFILFALNNDLPITFHCSESAAYGKSNYSNPFEMIELAKQYPQLRIAIAHMAHFNEKVYNGVIEEKIQNVYFDTSPFLHLCHIRLVNNVADSTCLEYSQPQKVLSKMLLRLPDRIMWGSDAPFNFTCNINNPAHNKDYKQFSLSKNVAILNSLSIEMQEQLTEKNVLSFLGKRSSKLKNN